MRSTSSPRVRLPAEWEPQSGVQLTWPNVEGDWKNRLDLIESCLAEIAREVSRRETLIIVCAAVSRVKKALRRARASMAAIRLYEIESNDIWARDHGAITVLRNGKPALLDFGFNGWGLKYGADFDNRITRRLAALKAFGETPVETLPWILEGGSIESDGAGTLLTTSHCLLSPNRNPALNRGQVDRLLRRCFGLRRVLWLEHGAIPGDDTDGHIDTLARFCDSRTIAYVGCDDPHDPCHDELAVMEEELRRFRTLERNPYRLVKLPLASPVFDEEGLRLPATYANFLIINGAVLAPTYDVPEDGEALRILRGCFPDHEVIGIDSRGPVLLYGALHCVTMQFPKGVLP